MTFAEAAHAKPRGSADIDPHRPRHGPAGQPPHPMADHPDAPQAKGQVAEPALALPRAPWDADQNRPR
jgi:hypothetical protein